MSLLRDRMIEDMQLHGFSASTQEVYVRAVSQMSEYVHHGCRLWGLRFQSSAGCSNPNADTNPGALVF